LHATGNQGREQAVTLIPEIRSVRYSFILIIPHASVRLEKQVIMLRQGRHEQSPKAITMINRELLAGVAEKLSRPFTPKSTRKA
jgi:hypothetical protein